MYCKRKQLFNKGNWREKRFGEKLCSKILDNQRLNNNPLSNTSSSWRKCMTNISHTHLSLALSHSHSEISLFWLKERDENISSPPSSFHYGNVLSSGFLLLQLMFLYFKKPSRCSSILSALYQDTQCTKKCKNRLNLPNFSPLRHDASECYWGVIFIRSITGTHMLAPGLNIAN